MRNLVFTATFNEAGNIERWLSGVRAHAPDAHLLVIDDSSPDGTSDIVRRAQREDGALDLIVRARKSGLGSAHRAAMLYALEGGYQALITMDADLSHDPRDITRLLAHLKSHDFVIGTRARGGSCDYTGVRRIMSTGGNLAARLLLPTGLSEYTTSFRAFNRSSLEALITNGIRDDGYAFFMECVYVLHRNGLSLGEVPIHFADRTKGQSKIPRNQIWLSASTLARLSIARLSRRSNPQGL
jgi:glycosyltransferase involved in cell wall biosynthesis